MSNWLDKSFEYLAALENWGREEAPQTSTSMARGEGGPK